MKKILILVCFVAIIAATVVAASGNIENTEGIDMQLFESEKLQILEMTDLYPSTAIVIDDSLETPIGPILENPVPRYYILPVIDTPVLTETVDLSGNIVSIPIDLGSPNSPISLDDTVIIID